MIGKIPSIKMLRTKLQESESKLGSKGSDSDKDFLGVVKREIEELDKELSGKRNNKDCEVDDLRLSSESDEIKHGSLEVSLSSEFSISEDFGRACWSSQSKLKAAKPPVQFKKPEKNAILVSENKELLRKVKELELRAIEDKKQMARVQEINNTLIKKINQNKSESEAKIANESKKAKSYKEIKASHKALIAENLDLKQDLCDAQTIIKVINKKYDSLLAASAEFEEKSSKMNKINEILKGHIRKLLQGSSFKLT